MRWKRAALAILFGLSACNSSSPAVSPGVDASAAPEDAANPPPVLDAAPLDAGAGDTGTRIDDAAPALDAQTGADAREAVDAGTSADAEPIQDAGTPADAQAAPDAQPSADGGTGFEVIHEKDTFTTLYAMSDVHGGYARAVSLLLQYGLISAAPATPDQVVWSGGDATLVVVGDLIDKGPQGLEVIDLFRALETSARQGGGELIVTLGNHEAEFLADPLNSKATASDGVDVEIQADGLMPAAVAADTDPRGHWLRTRPIGARVGSWFFAHSGNTHGLSLTDLKAMLGAALMQGGYADPAITGVDSILESKDWQSTAGIGAAYTQALGVGHIVVGHQPAALGPRGTIGTDGQGTLFRIDCGMSPDVNDSMGVLLEIAVASGQTVATQLAADGTRTVVWMGP